MTTAVSTTPQQNFSFPGPIGTKRRRMRSGGNVSTLTNNSPTPSEELLQDDHDGQNTGADGASAAPTTKCKATTIPIFLKKTYKMIESCNPAIASWTPDGEMFVVKDPETFATQVIPQYFDHNKFSSFARQLNFYGFRKMQSKPIRNSDFDAGTAKHVTFFNENFKRGRCDLLKNIQRSTRGGGGTSQQDHQREVQNLKEQVATLENTITEIQTEVEERMRRLELDMLARMEQMMLAMQQQKRGTQFPVQDTSVGSASSASQGTVTTAPVTVTNNSTTAWDANAFPRTYSIGLNPSQSTGTAVTFQQPAPVPRGDPPPPTLPPHPKQKQLPVNGFLPPTAPAGGTGRFNSLRGISALTRGISGLSRGASVESNASAVLMRNSWEDKFFSMLMLDGNGEPVAGQQGVVDPSGLVGPTPLAPGATAANPMDQQAMGMAVNNGMHQHQSSNGELNSGSDVGMP